MSVAFNSLFCWLGERPSAQWLLPKLKIREKIHPKQAKGKGDWHAGSANPTIQGGHVCRILSCTVPPSAPNLFLKNFGLGVETSMGHPPPFCVLLWLRITRSFLLKNSGEFDRKQNSPQKNNCFFFRVSSVLTGIHGTAMKTHLLWFLRKHLNCFYWSGQCSAQNGLRAISTGHIETKVFTSACTKV